MNTNIINVTGYVTYANHLVVGAPGHVGVTGENVAEQTTQQEPNKGTVGEEQAQSRLITALMEHSLEMLENETEQAKARAEELKTLTECMKIAAKLSKGEASFEEIRYLQKHGIEMYSMAMALRDPEIEDDKGNETTTEIKGENDSSGAQNNNVAVQMASATSDTQDV